MNANTKRSLLEAQKRTPRYLFRSWNDTDEISGGYKGLNTVEAITPLGLSGTRKGDTSSIYDMKRNELGNMVVSHLAWEKGTFRTKLSSWTASLQIAFNFARGNKKNCFISIIDTKELRGRNVIVHAHQLAFLTGDTQYDHEYLACGIINGSAHKAVPLSAFTAICDPIHGMYKMPISIRATATWDSTKFNITKDEIKAAKSVADQYGPKFGAAIMVAILCNKPRSPDLWKDGIQPDDLLPVAKAMDGFEVPQELCGDDTILADVVYTENYGDITQMIRMLRAVVDYRHGKGARQRQKKAE